MGLFGVVLFALLVQLCGGATVCQITREGNCPGGNVSAGVFNETAANGTICLGRASYYQNLCQNNGITTARAMGSGVSTTVGNYCQITRRGSCPNNPSFANSTFRDIFGERNLSATIEEPCLQRALAYQIYCGNTSTTTAFFGGTGLSRRYPAYCFITRRGNCPGFTRFANKTFQAIQEEDTSGATTESGCFVAADTYQSRCGNTSFTTAKYLPSGNFKRVPQYCMITIEGNCINRQENSNKTIQDIAGEDTLNATVESSCLKRAKDFFNWCGGGVIVTARYVPTGAVRYWGNYCLITRNGTCPSQPAYANRSFRAINAESYLNNTPPTACFKKAVDYQCVCNSGGSTRATYGNSALNYTSTLCCYQPNATCGSSCVDLTRNNNHCGSCGNVCPVGSNCVNSTCVSVCSGSTIYCNSSCIDGTSDNNNCGSCGNVCSAGTTCQNSTCVSICSGSTIYCNSSCIDGTSDNNNCGSCGNVCGAGTTCQNSTCVSICSGSTIYCNSSCVDPTSDNNNCGSCGNVCGAGTACQNSTCEVVCPPGLVNCNSTCVMLSSSATNCGACGNACNPGYTCAYGTCQCYNTVCNGTCANLGFDPNNCGQCGRVCPGPCATGMCMTS